MTDPIAAPTEDSIELIAPIKLPRIFPIIPARRDSTKHSAELKTLLIICLKILPIISSSPLRIL